MELIHNFEITILLSIQNFGTGWITPMKWITELGSEQFFILLMPIFLWCVDYYLGVRVGIMLLLSAQINSFFKLIFHSPRPFWVTDQIKAHTIETSFGVPSGHAMNTLSVFGMIAKGLRDRWITILCAVLILLVGVSRLFLGMHFISDVIIGWVIAGGLLILISQVEKPLWNWFKKFSTIHQVIMILISSLLWVAIALVLSEVMKDDPFPILWVQNSMKAIGVPPDPLNMEGAITNAGIWAGLGLGVLWMIKSHGYQTKGTWIQYISRIVIGISGTLLLWRGLGMIFPDGTDLIAFGLRWFRYTLVGLWVSTVAPWIFIKAGLAKPRNNGDLS